MFVYTFRSSAIKWVVPVLLCIAALAGYACFAHGGRPAAHDGAIVLKAGTAAERMSFISQFGWEVAEDPAEVAEVVIPAQFDATYEAYNEIQKKQNMDLLPYAGQRVKRWSYAVKNYPGFEGREDVIRLNMLVYEGLVIGGDVCSLEAGGFMRTFDPPERPMRDVGSQRTDQNRG